MMPGPLQILLILVVAVLLFGGRGKISAIMGDVAKGIRSFRKGLGDPTDDTTAEPRPQLNDAKTIDAQTTREGQRDKV
jgi:sec-independent protein translocase protein TatA